MKKILFLAITLLVMTGCSKEEDNNKDFSMDSSIQNPEFDISSYHTPDLQNPYITICKEDSNYVFISGLNDNKVWYGKYNRKNKKAIYTHADNEPISKIKVDMGYGNYKEIYPNFIRYGSSISRDKYNVNMLFMCADEISNISSEDFYLRLDFLSKSKLIKTFIPVYDPKDYSTIYLRYWYDNSILFAVNNYAVCFGYDGSILHEVHGDKISYGNDVYPISLTQLIKIDTNKGLRIILYNIETDIKSTGDIAYEVYSGNDKVEDVSVDILSNTIKIKFKTIDFQGNISEHSKEIILNTKL